MSAFSSAEKPALLSHSVAKPVDSSLLAEVRKLGRYPKRYKRPADDAQKSENSLAKRLCKAWLSLPEGERQQLEEMKAHSAAKSVRTSLVDRVQQLGRYPKTFHRPANAEERAENNLADRVSKAWKSLSEGDRIQLDALQNEMQWMRKRESEWAQTTNQRLRQERQTEKRRKQAAERKAKLRHLLAKLRTSKVRCDCYDFSQWQWLWRRNPELTKRLRDAGHHTMTCKLMTQCATELGRGGLIKAIDDDDCVSSDESWEGSEYPEDLLGVRRKRKRLKKIYKENKDLFCWPETFEFSGVVGCCASCGSYITCGVFHTGRVECDDDLSVTSDYTQLTFRHHRSFKNELCDDGVHLPQISGKWEQLFAPLASTPGEDVGVTKREYNWLLKQCHAKADWQLRLWRVSWRGKLVRSKQPHLEWRSDPPDDWESGRAFAETFASEETFAEETIFRARRPPLRQEPEWQLDDLDVAAAWKRFNPLVLDSVTPEDLLAVGIKTIASLGRWPRQAVEDATTPSARLEFILARFLDAAIAKPMFFYHCADFFKVIRCRSQLAALRLKHSASKPVDDAGDGAAKPVDDPPVHSCLKEMVQSLGLEPQPVSASAVFRHTPAQNIRCVDLQKKALLSALGHDGFFHKLELGWQHTQPWDRFFMFNKDFQAYNEKRMTAEDPKAHMWNARKSFVDYTWCVTASDWMAKLVWLDMHEHSELDRRSGMLTEWRQSTEQRLCRVAKESVRWPVRFDEWGHESCYWDWVHAITGSKKPVLQNLGVELFEWHGQANPGCVESGKQVCPLPVQVMAEVQQWYNRRNRSDPEFRFSGPSEPYKAFDFSAKLGKSIAQCIRDGRSQTKIADFLRERPWFGLSGLWPEMWKHPGSAEWRPEMCFLWLGGTYARNLDLFDERQGTAGWIHTHMRPLGIQPPEAAVKSLQHSFHYKDEFRAFAEQWQRGPWIGPAPHPDAVLSPARQLLYYVRHSACQDRVSCYERSRKRTSVKDADMQSLCVSCDEAKKVNWPARGEVLFPSATAPKPPDPDVWLSNVYLRECMKEPLREYR